MTSKSVASYKNAHGKIEYGMTNDYTEAKPAIHIGFLNFQPFPHYPEFYAKFKLINEKTGMIYSDKFQLNVVDLTQIELATDKDKTHQVDL